MAVIVTGTFVLPSGEVATGRVITLRRADRGVVAFGDDAVIPDDVTVTADDDGQVLFDILPGNYVGFARTNGNLTATFTLAVPDVAEIDVADIINAAAVPDAPQSVLPDGLPGQFVSYGLDGEPIAVDLPEGNLPAGVEGQVVGYGPGGVPVAVDAQAGPQGEQGSARYPRTKRRYRRCGAAGCAGNSRGDWPARTTRFAGRARACWANG